MAIQKDARIENSVVEVDQDSDWELQMDDEEGLFEEYLDPYEEKRKKVSKRGKRTSDWRRVERLQEDIRLRRALADFDEYDFEFADNGSSSAYSH